ncbi:MAG: PAS domain-containing protein [Deltaproteobacteria bacterium]|nr:PAS domain-containing protein [Deltaproteobacteria bacterium]
MQPKNNPLSLLAKKKPEKLLRSVLELSSEGIILIDATLRIIEVNPKIQELYRIPYERLIGEDLRKLLDTQGRETLQEIILGLEDGRTWIGPVACWLDEKDPVPAKISLKRTDMSNQRLFLLVLEDPRSFKTLEENLSREKVQTREMYITLRNVMKAIEQEKKGWEGEIANKIEKYLLPALERVKREPYGEMRNSYLDLIREHLLGLTRGFSRELDGRFLRLTRSEMRICRYIQGGYSTKEISEAMHTSFETIQTHRKNIRKKLGLRGRTINLYSYLSSRQRQPESSR